MSSNAHRAGSGHLQVQMVAGRSAVTSVWATSPLKILTPCARGSTVWAYLSSYGGGLVAGDEINISVHVGPRASCFLGTQASTRVYRNPSARPCTHSLRATVEEGALLILAPDPVQAFSAGRYRQRQEFHLGPDSGLVLVDWLCSGRAARGERWAFSCYQSRNEIFFGTESILVDSLLLDPEDGPLAGQFRLGRFNCLALVVLIGYPFSEVSTELAGELAELPLTPRPQVACSISRIRQGALLRIAGESVESVRAEIQQRLAFLCQSLQGELWSRKW